MFKLATIRIEESLYRQVCKCDPTGRDKFTSGVIFIIREYLRIKRG